MTDDHAHDDDDDLTILSETENYAVLLGQDMDGAPVYNIEMGNLTLHLYQEEWDELKELLNAA